METTISRKHTSLRRWVLEYAATHVVRAAEIAHIAVPPLGAGRHWHADDNIFERLCPGVLVHVCSIARIWFYAHNRTLH